MARRPALWVPERGEIIFIEHSPHVGKEMPGLHPMLVCSTAAFAGRTGVVIGFPMTHALTPGAQGTTRCSPLRSRNWTPSVVSAIAERWLASIRKNGNRLRVSRHPDAQPLTMRAMDVSLFGTYAAVQVANALANMIQQSRRPQDRRLR